MPLPGFMPSGGFMGGISGFLGATTAQGYGSTSLAINKPGGVVSGDILIAIMSNIVSYGATTWTGASGWTEAIDQGAHPSLRVAYRVVDGSEGSSFTFTASTSSDPIGCILAYSGYGWDTAGASVTTLTGDGDVVISAITSAGGILIAAVASSDFAVSQSWTQSTPTNMTLRASKTHSVNFHMISVFDQTVSAGSTGTRTSTIGGGTTGANGGILVGLA